MPKEPNKSVAKQVGEQAQPPSSEAGEAALADISSLDDQLAAFADDLIAGDLEDTDGKVVESVAGESGSPDPVAPDPVAGDPVAAETDASEPESQDLADPPPPTVTADKGTSEDADDNAALDEGGGETAVETGVETEDEAEVDAEVEAETEADAPPDAGTADTQASDNELASPPSPSGEDATAQSQPDDAKASDSQPATDQASPDTETESAPEPVGEPAPETTSTETPKPAAKTPTAARIKAAIAPLLSIAKPIAIKAVTKLSAPLASRPPIVRVIVGLIAIWTALLAIVMVGLVTTRKAEPPKTSQAPVELASPSAPSAGAADSAD